jgi:CheY-like chemotaxis protein
MRNLTARQSGLLVEDNRINQIVASKFLVTWGIEVDIANNGKEALEMIQQKLYDIVLMDVQMPEMDGYEAVLKIRALGKPYFKEVPILALTASAMHGMRDKVQEVGMNDFISKPFIPSNYTIGASRHDYQICVWRPIKKTFLPGAKQCGGGKSA